MQIVPSMGRTIRKEERGDEMQAGLSDKRKTIRERGARRFQQKEKKKSFLGESTFD